MRARGRIASAILLLLASIARVSADDARVPFATGEYPPYSSVELPGNGYSVRLVAAACAAAGITAGFGFYPWKRAESLLERGEAFAAFPYARTAERDARFLFSAPLYDVVNVVAYHCGNPRTSGPVAYSGPRDLAPFRVAIIRGSFAEPALRTAAANLTELNDVDQGIAMLLADRVDFYVEDEATIAHAIARHFSGEQRNIAYLPQPFSSAVPNYLMISRGYPGAAALLQRFNAGLDRLHHSGEYEELMEELTRARQRVGSPACPGQAPHRSAP